MINKINWPNSIDQELSRLKYEFSDSSLTYQLKLNEFKIFFEKKTTNFIIKPNQWLEAQHKDKNIHEPGMVAWLITLAKYFKNHKVRFYDIGALFGYHSFIAKNLFENINITAVEANPISAEYISKNINNNEKDKFRIINAFISNKNGNFTYLIDVFSFTEKGDKKYYKKIFTLKIKDLIKNFINLFGNRYFLSEHLIRKIDTILLTDLFNKNKDNEIEIIKIDAEGYQAIFLPPAINVLIERNFIILLELDNKETMKEFGTSNNELLQTFIIKGYEAYWMDHRTGSKVQKINKIDEEYDRNSLLILMPSKFV